MVGRDLTRLIALTVFFLGGDSRFAVAVESGAKAEPASFQERSDSVVQWLEQLKKAEDRGVFRPNASDPSALETVPKKDDLTEFTAQRAIKTRLLLRAYRILNDRIDPSVDTNRPSSPLKMSLLTAVVF